MIVTYFFNHPVDYGQLLQSCENVFHVSPKTNKIEFIFRIFQTYCFKHWSLRRIFGMVQQKKLHCFKEKKFMCVKFY